MDLSRDLGTDWFESVLGFQNWSAKSVRICKLRCRDSWAAESVRIFEFESRDSLSAESVRFFFKLGSRVYRDRSVLLIRNAAVHGPPKQSVSLKMDAMIHGALNCAVALKTFSLKSKASESRCFRLK